MQVGARGLRLGLTLLATMSAVVVAGCGSSKTSASTKRAAASPAASGTSSKMASGMAMPAGSATCVSPAAGSQTVKTGSHIFVLSVGPSVTMYSAKQAHRMHPKRGEVMLGGHMQGSGMGSMSGGAPMSGMSATRHLEVHICTRQGDKVVTAPAPTITMSSGSQTTMVPVAEMEGVGEGVRDFHFGNNVQMTKGQTYTVAVSQEHDHAVFHVTPG